MSNKNDRKRAMTAGFIMILLLISLVPMSFFGAGDDYGMDSDLSSADASFLPAASPTPSYFGYTDLYPSSRGDVNGDGYDDLLIADSSFDNGSDMNVGQVHLIFGKPSGWAMDTVMDADVTFEGEAGSNWAGYSHCIPGDVNGDGYDDIIISSMMNSEYDTRAGQVYLILGKATGWPKWLLLEDADASFWGENAQDGIGWAISGAGDVNGDGLADFLIGTLDNRDFGPRSGKVYLILGKPFGWVNDVNVSTASIASFYGEYGNDCAGTVSAAGDVNGDHYDDFLVGSACADSLKGKAYLLFGKPDGWTKNANLSTADASFLGVNPSGQAGYGLMGAGDVNGDGYDDVLITATWDSTTSEVYLILGKDNGWAKNVSLSNADASFLNEAAGDYLGWGLGGGGDVNGDGLDDFIMGATGNDENGNGAGQSYLLYGKTAGWSFGADVGTAATASFLGEAASDDSGVVASILGDINGDGMNDILIVSDGNQEVSSNSGQAYIIFQVKNQQPTALTSVKAYSTPDYLNETAFALQGDTIYVEVQGTDRNASRADVAIVTIKSDLNPVGFRVPLYETGVNTGTYRGEFNIMGRTHKDYKWIAADIGDVVEVVSFTDPTKTATITVGGIELSPKSAPMTVLEDDSFDVHFDAANVTGPTWDIQTNATWLEWNETIQNISGAPNNTNVGVYYVNVTVADHLRRSDSHNLSVTVENLVPEIETADVLTATEDTLYEVDYNSTDDGQGVITWDMDTDAGAWLVLNADTGVLNGTPANADVGGFYVNISVDDGNGGLDWSNFTLTVGNTNDPPTISTLDVTTIDEDAEYVVDYEVDDVDVGDVHTWSVVTNATWLDLDTATGNLTGTPVNDDVGVYYVNITVKDTGNDTDFHNFTLEVVNVNDVPVWDVVPANVTITSIDTYEFDVNASDVDAGDTLTYGLTVTPASTTAKMNTTSGLITWTPSGLGNFTFNVSVTDDVETIYHEFVIKVEFKNSPPEARLDTPENGAVVQTSKPALYWTVSEPNVDDMANLTSDVYLSGDQSKVDALDVSVRVATALTTFTYTPATDLIPGTKYYWTVIPSDGIDVGTCLNGTFNFTVSSTVVLNKAPTVESISAKKVKVGDKWQYTIQASDPDGDVLTITLQNAPEGMTVSSGVITWKPKDSQKGPHTVTVLVTDGKVATPASTTFTITVEEAEETGLGDMMIPLTIVVIIVIAIIALLAMGGKKKEPEEDEDEEVDEDEDEEE